METVLQVLAVVFLVGLAAVVVRAVLFVRSVVRLARRATELMPGPGRAVAVLRRDLRRDVVGTEQAVQIGLAAGRPVHPLVGIVERLAQHAAALDVDLAVIATEPTASRRRRLLGAQRERVEVVHRALGQVRQGVLVSGVAVDEAVPAPVLADLDRELTTLRFRAEAYQELARLS